MDGFEDFEIENFVKIKNNGDYKKIDFRVNGLILK